MACSRITYQRGYSPWSITKLSTINTPHSNRTYSLNVPLISMEKWLSHDYDLCTMLWPCSPYINMFSVPSCSFIHFTTYFVTFSLHMLTTPSKNVYFICLHSIRAFYTCTSVCIHSELGLNPLYTTQEHTINHTRTHYKPHKNTLNHTRTHYKPHKNTLLTTQEHTINHTRTNYKNTRTHYKPHKNTL